MLRLIQTGYYYLFYRFYRLFKVLDAFDAYSPFQKRTTEMEPWGLMSILCIGVVSSIPGYLIIYAGIDIYEISPLFVILMITVSVFAFNYYVFLYKGKWKSILLRFNRLPDNKQRIGIFFFWLFVIGVFANLVLMFSLLKSVSEIPA